MLPQKVVESGEIVGKEKVGKPYSRRQMFVFAVVEITAVVTTIPKVPSFDGEKNQEIFHQPPVSYHPYQP